MRNGFSRTLDADAGVKEFQVLMGAKRESPPDAQVYGLGQWAGAVRIGGCWHGACRTCRNRRSPERVWTLLALPLESLPTALTVKGAGGEGQHGRRPMLVLALSGLLLFRMAASTGRTASIPPLCRSNGCSGAAAGCHREGGT
jgi:hypothetical protein